MHLRRLARENGKRQKSEVTPGVEKSFSVMHSISSSGGLSPPLPYPADIVESHCSSVRSIVLDGRQEIFETDRKQKERRAISGEPQE